MHGAAVSISRDEKSNNTDHMSPIPASFLDVLADRIHQLDLEGRKLRHVGTLDPEPDLAVNAVARQRQGPEGRPVHWLQHASEMAHQAWIIRSTFEAQNLKIRQSQDFLHVAWDLAQHGNL